MVAEYVGGDDDTLVAAPPRLLLQGCASKEPRLQGSKREGQEFVYDVRGGAAQVRFERGCEAQFRQPWSRADVTIVMRGRGLVDGFGSSGLAAEL